MQRLHACLILQSAIKVLALHNVKDFEHLTAEVVAAQHDAANIKAEGMRNEALDSWKCKASVTWNRMRNHVLSSSMAHPIRLLVTSQLAHLAASIPGDFVETGVALGGASILMMAVLEDVHDTSKRHFACDSFRGLPKGAPQDFSRNNNCSLESRSASGAIGCGHARGNVQEAQTLAHMQGLFKYSQSAFRGTVRASGVPSSRMVVVEGWFNESLPPPGLDRIAFLRLDGDLYASTRDVLSALYSRVSIGGAIFIDDYGSFGGCRLAVDEFREQNGISTPMIKVWQNFTPRALKTYSPQTRAGYGFEAVWWIKA
jgi:hypothetical protein